MKVWTNKWGACAGLLFCFLLLELFFFNSAFLFHGDHERDLRLATVWVQHGEWPRSSPSISPLPFELGPLLYLILAPAVSISPDPLFVRVYFLVLATLGFAIWFGVLRKELTSLGSAVGLFALLSSTFAFEMSRQLWHSSLLPIPVAGFFWATYHLLKDDGFTWKHSVTAGICAAFSVQLHLAASVYVALLILLGIWRAKSLGMKTLGTMSLGFCVAIFPMAQALYRAISGGALDRLNRGVGHWQPAEIWDVLLFFSENVSNVWGDHLGPLLTWPTLLIMGLGCWRSMTAGTRFQKFMLLNVGLGFVVETLLLGNQMAFRYMHANMYAAFALVAIGADWVAHWLPSQKLSKVLLGMASLVVLEAMISPVPHAQRDGWMSCLEQRSVARKVNEYFPANDQLKERLIHGVYFGDQMGLGHLNTLWPAEPGTEPPADMHLLVLPEDLSLAPPPERVTSVLKVEEGERAILLYQFRPALLYKTLEFNGPAAPDLKQKWRRGRTSPHGATNYVLVQVDEPTQISVMAIADRGGCGIRATLESERVEVTPVESDGYGGAYFYRINLPSRGQLMLELQRCSRLRFVDAW